MRGESRREQESECVGSCEHIAEGGTKYDAKVEFLVPPSLQCQPKEAGTLTSSPLPICIPNACHFVHVNIDLIKTFCFYSYIIKT